MMDFAIKVDDDHFRYLRVQKGNLDPFASDRVEWHRRYESDIKRTYEEIRPFLPPVCQRILDVGSGLGGIDILLSRHYAEAAPASGPEFAPTLHLLDGDEDPPVMNLHRETFNSMTVACSFLTTNGIKAERLHCYTPETREFFKPFDLIVSFGSWCFHYPPDVYLRRLLDGGAESRDTRFIVDMRAGKQWERFFWAAGYRSLAVVRASKKFARTVWVRA